MNQKFALACLLLLLLPVSALSQRGGQRYLDTIFTEYRLQSDIQYGQATAAGGSTKKLLLDVYTPAGDTATARPLIVFIHGGGFKSGDKVTHFGTRLCRGLARRGYVVASINYRTTSKIPNDTVHFEAMIRAVQDGKAAVRFFRRFAAEYGVDTSQIFVTGSSAGSITALHMAYLDDGEIPSYVNVAAIGTLEGASGNPGYSSRVQGVISNWGALADYRWMKSGDPPVYCVHGTADVTVPCDSSFGDGPFKYGSTIIHANAVSLGIPSGLRLFSNTGHTLDNSGAKQDSAITDFTAWLYTILRHTSSTGIKERGTLLVPQTPDLHQEYLNSFDPETAICFELAPRQEVDRSVDDTSGNRARMMRVYVLPGAHQTRWNGTDEEGRSVFILGPLLPSVITQGYVDGQGSPFSTIMSFLPGGSLWV